MFIWKFCHDSCRIMILHFCHAIFKKKTDIILFLFFHTLYWVIINLLIIYHFERWILQCSDSQDLLTVSLTICLLDHKKLLSVWFYFSCLVHCLQLIIFWLIWIEYLSYILFWLAWFASSLNCHHLSYFLTDYSWHSIQTALFVFSSLLIHTDCNYQFCIIWNMRHRLAELSLHVFFSCCTSWFMLNDSDCSWCICVLLICLRSYMLSHYDWMLYICCISFLSDIFWWHICIHSSWSTVWFCSLHEITCNSSVCCETTSSCWSAN